MDVHATVLDFMGLQPPRPVDGVSPLPAIRGERSQVRDSVLFGWWGRRVNWTDGHHVYMRTPATADNQPLAFYTNRWSTAPWWSLPLPDERTTFGRYLPRVDMPVGRHPVTTAEMGRLHSVQLSDLQQGSFLFDLEGDAGEQHNLVGTALEAEAAARLRAAMEAQGAPAEQFARLGL